MEGGFAGKVTLNESMITGNQYPPLECRFWVVGGNHKSEAVFKIPAEKIGKDTTLAQIIKLVESAQGSKPLFRG